MYTVKGMLRLVRSKLQEQNKTKITDQMILDALNIAKDDCFNLVARRYPDAIGAAIDLVVDKAEGTFTVPEDAFEQRLTRVYRVQSSYSAPLERVEYRKLDEFIGQSGVPTHYTVMGTTGYIVPKPSLGAYTYRAAYIRDLPPLVEEQGRVTAFTSGVNPTIVLDEVGADLTNDINDLNRFVNIIDRQTGLIKGTLEIQSIDADSKTITFKSSPREKVFNRTVDNELPVSLELDDYVCVAEGSCVLFFKKPASNYIIQHATTEIKRSLGMDAQLEETALKRFEKDLDALKSKRESSTRVHRMRNRPIGRR